MNREPAFYWPAHPTAREQLAHELYLHELDQERRDRRERICRKRRHHALWQQVWPYLAGLLFLGGTMLALWGGTP